MHKDIASFFNVICLGIDVLADDISKPWTDGNFGIIELNAGPGVFMHLAPAIGGSIDVPGHIMEAHFPRGGYARVPIIAGNCITTTLAEKVRERVLKVKPDLFVGILTVDGVHFNGDFFFKNERHDQNVKIILRHPGVEMALFNHTKDDIWDYGLFHQGADVVILEEPGSAEEALRRDLLPDGCLIEIVEGILTVTRGEDEVSHPIEGDTEEAKLDAVLQALDPILPDLVGMYA